MSIVMLVQYGTPVILLGLIISNVWLTVTVKNLLISVRDIKKSVMWSDTCEKMHEGVDGRLDRLEKQANSK